MVLTCHGVFSGSVFSFSSVVGGIVASGLIVCFPFLEADHFPRWSWGTCYVKKWERFYNVSHSVAHTAFHVTVHLTNTHGPTYVSTVYGSFIFHRYFSWLLFLPSSLHPCNCCFIIRGTVWLGGGQLRITCWNHFPWVEMAETRPSLGVHKSFRKETAFFFWAFFPSLPFALTLLFN